MKNDWWWRWTVERPAALGDWLWLVLVIQPANFLNRITLRKVIAFIPVVILIVAFAHNIPLPAEVLFLGDALAYLDILTILFLVTAIGRAGAVLYFVRQIVRNVGRRLAKAIEPIDRRADSRHQRANTGALRRLILDMKKKDDEHGPHSWGLPA
jgi:hypothetical protein